MGIERGRVMNKQNILEESSCKNKKLENLINEIEMKKKKLNYKLQNNKSKVISEGIILLSQDLDRLIVEYIKVKSNT